MSSAMQFIGAAAKGARRNRRGLVMTAIRDAIEHHLKFEPGDVLRCGELHQWYENHPHDYYAQAITSGNESFVKTYEADLGFTPWLWPGRLVRGRGDGVSDNERLCRGSKIWYVQRGEARLWDVTSLDNEQLTIVLHREEEIDDRAQYCQACGARKYNRNAKKVNGRKTFTRAQFAELTGRLNGYRLAGILEVDGVISWDLRPVTDGVSADERCWLGTVFTRKTYYTGVIQQDVVILQGRGITLHGHTIRQCRGQRKQRLREFEREFTEVWASGWQSERPITLDQPIPVSEIELESWSRAGKLPDLRRRLRGRETITARELLAGVVNVRAATRNLSYMLRNWGRNERLAAEQAEQAKRREQDRAALRLRLEPYLDVQVTLADSFAAGNCAGGSVGWLNREFPDSLAGVKLDLNEDQLKKRLSKLKRSMTVRQILESPQALDSFYVVGTIRQAVRREKGVSL